MTNQLLVTSGLGLITLGFLPTPDDVTIISPVIQILGGAVLVIIGLSKKK